MGKDYYATLGCAKDADDDALKKAYRKAAMKHHPDRNPDDPAAEERFKEVAEAYDVLSDKNKRAVYDQYGEEGLKAGPPPGEAPGTSSGGPGPGFGYQFQGDPNDIFSQFFKTKMRRTNSFNGHEPGGGEDHFADFHHNFGMGGFGGLGDMGGMGGPKKSITVNLVCTLEDLFHGCKKKLKIKRKSIKLEREPEKVVEIDVKAGWKAGTKITFRGEGDELPGGVAQDITFVIKEARHKTFTRDGSDLVHHVTIPLVDALSGCQVDVPTLDERILRVNVRDVVHPTYSKVVANEGMPSSKQEGVRGNLVITFEVMYPKELSMEQKAAVKAALPRA